MESEKTLVTVYVACGQPEAEIIKGHLNIEGIPAVLKYESLGPVYGLTIDGLGQVQVQVPSKYEQRAKELINNSGNIEFDDEPTD